MKRCPQCNRTYTDDALSFCLDDGSPLMSTTAPSSFDPSATVAYPQPRDTTPQPTIAYPGAAPPPQPPPSWSPMPPVQPQKRSVWPWVLGIGAVLVFIGIGLVILVIAIASITSNNNNNRIANTNRNSNTNSNRSASNANTNTNTNTNTNSNTDTRSSTFTDDFSTQKWSTRSDSYGRAWYSSEEYHMRATKGYYIVMYGPDQSEYKTKDATVRVGLRSLDGNGPSSGYGLVVHGELKNNNLEDYAFLIFNKANPQYKIVVHKGGVETKLVDWTTSGVIRTGTTPNQLEVRIRDRKLDFYINGQFITSVTDSETYLTGRVGFYTSDTNEVAFDDLEISK